MKLLSQIFENFNRFGQRPAFIIDDCSYSYAQLSSQVSKIRSIIRLIIPEKQNLVGLLVNNDLQTYACILALWFEGKGYIPITEKTPDARLEAIIKDAHLSCILFSANSRKIAGIEMVDLNSEMTANVSEFDEHKFSNDFCAYVLFTSGSTGTPKGVPISTLNLFSFVQAINSSGIKLKPEDKCLQMFQLSFDVSVMSFVLPLLVGASVYPISNKGVKFQKVYSAIKTYQLSVAFMVPSIAKYLRPYFKELQLESLRLSLFAGEALSFSLMQEWTKVAVNAEIYNGYGPTENTILSTVYKFGGNEKDALNDVVSIGPALDGNQLLIFNEKGESIAGGQKGELCISGAQLTKGYLANEEKNKEMFFNKAVAGKLVRFYKSGDICSRDDSGNFFYHGRIDSQVKIQGYRVEIQDVEFAIRKVLQNDFTVVAYQNNFGNLELGLLIVGESIDINSLKKNIKSLLPSYMVPSAVKFCKELPLNTSGKISSSEIKHIFSNGTISS